ncbi:MAG: Sua5/YciO/YrdC/YwlC family protein [Candidatus Magasanikbacteria bacterium]|nr:Sua5/YciO/YrdC/YwlC family protein [Candidatus Magasanikbacteria bacterium]
MLAFLSFVEAVAALKRGEIIFYPTETSYAIGGDAADSQTAAKIMLLKGRAVNKTLPAIVSSPAMALRYAVFSKLANRLARTYWPGALTLVLPVASKLSGTLSHGVLREESLVPSGMPGAVIAETAQAPYGDAEGSPAKFIALRVSSHPVARKLAEKLERPLISTSANPSGLPPYFDPEKIAAARWPSHIKIAGILSGGVLPKNEPSTILKVVGEFAEVVRKGAVAFKGGHF